MRQFCAVVSLIAVALMFGGLLSGDEKKPTKKGYLPSGWRKLNLSASQKEQIYTIQADYRTKIVSLKKQIDALEKMRNAELVKVLTAKQRAQLAGLPEEGSRDKDAATKDKKADKVKEKTAGKDKP